MADYRIRETGEIVGQGNLAAMFPNVSIPSVMTPEDMDAIGIDRIDDPGAPICGTFEVAIADGTELINGVWTKTYKIVQMPDGAIEQMTNDCWTSIRQERNARLSACDWTQLPDAPVNAPDWVAYRQQLRDITNQADPFNIIWPVEPQ